MVGHQPQPRHRQPLSHAPRELLARSDRQALAAFLLLVVITVFLAVHGP